MNVKKILSQNLKAYRAYYGLSQLAMSERVHMSYRGYGKLERLEVSTTIDTVEKVATYLGLTPAMLLCPDMMRHVKDLPFVLQITVDDEDDKEEATEEIAEENIALQELLEEATELVITQAEPEESADDSEE